MLNNLSIKNFAIIDDAQIDFDNGFTVMTGETGAGKSIIIDALSLLVGERSASSMIRKGEKKATIQGVFDFPEQDLTAFGIEKDDQLIIRREINRKGHNLISANGVLLTLKQLTEIGQNLIKISAQFDNRQLLDSDLQAELVDRFGSADFSEQLKHYREKYSDYAQLRRELNQQDQNERDRQSRLDFLTFEAQELGNLKIQPNELEQLQQRDKQIKNFEKIYELLSTAVRDLDDSQDNSALTMLDDALTNLRSLSSIDNSYASSSAALESNYLDLQELARDLKVRFSDLAFDDQEAQQVADRISELRTAERKYHRSSDDLVDYLAKIKKEITTLSNYDQDRQEKQARFQALRKETIQLANQLHDMRLQTAARLEKKIQENLSDLLLGEAVFQIHVQETKKLTANGLDEVDFWIQTNPGEANLPVNQIASGGEISRILLALTNVFSNAMSVATMIFDEVDTGVSGRAAVAIAKKMKAISEHRQVISISHLPQVAAAADQQLQIEKSGHQGRTLTNIQALDYQGRILSIANMLSGEKITDQSKANAQQLLGQKK
ncbi:MAG: DNA repair protein RecN [Oenococcus sp.]|uniref:DNA repair protein RecN n=1 Tax=Oenococcus sp. TaxID=1979414 RepID=UPI0039EC12DC